MRDLIKYTNEYNVANFEDYQIKYRKKKIIENIVAYEPKRILEIGCGMEPLFTQINSKAIDLFTVVEPSDVFFNKAIELSESVNMNIKCKNSCFTFSQEYYNDNYDMIICASLLHEIEDVENFCLDIRNISRKHTVIHINVPNADSMHREIAKCMGIINDNMQLTERNIQYQQSRVFNIYTLTNLLIKLGFEIIDIGTFFIKPFTHAQMYSMLEKKIIDNNVLDGLYKLSSQNAYKNLGSEIWCNVRIQ